MHAIEIETPIINHRIEISSQLLPASAARAKVIVMFDDDPPAAAAPVHGDVLALARAARQQFPQSDPAELMRTLEQQRSEWDRPL
jgi:hypothetical protein